VSPGERLPADAQLLSEAASFDESALTGESVPIERLRDEKSPRRQFTGGSCRAAQSRFAAR